MCALSLHEKEVLNERFLSAARTLIANKHQHMETAQRAAILAMQYIRHWINNYRNFHKM